MPDRRGGLRNDTSQVDPPADAQHERRLGRRRTYNRRRDDQVVSPPYFEVFERIATALERIAESVGSVSTTSPETGAAESPEAESPEAESPQQD